MPTLRQRGAEPAPPSPDPSAAVLLEFFKALSDPLRLRMAGMLATAPATLAELARALGVDARAIPRQLAQLEASGVVRQRGDGSYEFDTEGVRDRAMRMLDSPRTRALAGATDERSKVLASFFRGGVLQGWPAGDLRKLIVLREIAARFNRRRSYTEPEVNEILRPLYADYTSLRRALVDYHLMNRHRGVYWLGEGSAEPADADSTSETPENDPALENQD